MNVKNIIILTACSVLFAACNATKTVVTYTVHTDQVEPKKIMELLQASERVLQSRLAAANVEDAIVSVTPETKGGGKMTITLDEVEHESVVDRMAMQPFTFDFRIASEPKEKTSTSPEDVQWDKTTLTGSSIFWLTAGEDEGARRASVNIEFTPEGRSKIEKIFSENNGKDLGIFVRNLLVSKITIGEVPLTNTIIIAGIPSIEIAKIFSDDVNTGLHVQFKRQ